MNWFRICFLWKYLYYLKYATFGELEPHEVLILLYFV